MRARACIGQLADSTVLVTGASQGIGRAVALAHPRERADLLLVARREPLECVREEVEAIGARAVGVAANVGDVTAAKERLDIEGGTRWHQLMNQSQ